jgi:SAM-dependent methyltransferase
MRLFGGTGIDPFVERFLRSNPALLERKVVLDIPAGSGHMSRILRSLGATVEAFDLFPEQFEVDGLECVKADLSGKIPAPDSHADLILSQEGIEHVPNQVSMFREFNRVLKRGGTLLITTPNYSNLRIKLRQLLAESEYAFKRMAPNEIDSIWGAGDREVYFGHVFPVGIQKLRCLGRVSGFGIERVHHTRVNGSSLALMFLFYPLILLVNWLAYQRAMRKPRDVRRDEKKRVYGEILKFGIDPRILVDGYLFVEMVKESELEDVFAGLRATARGCCGGAGRGS